MKACQRRRQLSPEAAMAASFPRSRRPSNGMSARPRSPAGDPMTSAICAPTACGRSRGDDERAEAAAAPGPNCPAFTGGIARIPSDRQRRDAVVLVWLLVVLLKMMLLT
jgi:hypothetical protein